MRVTPSAFFTARVGSDRVPVIPKAASDGPMARTTNFEDWPETMKPPIMTLFIQMCVSNGLLSKWRDELLKGFPIANESSFAFARRKRARCFAGDQPSQGYGSAS